MLLRRIVVGTDFSETSLAALATAYNLALENHSTLYLLHVVIEDHLHPGSGVIAPVRDSYIKEMNQLALLIPEECREKVKARRVLLVGDPAKTIARFAQEKHADLIVVGTHGRTGLNRLLLGSTSEHLLRYAPCQVLVVNTRVESETATELASQ
jgi:nucleotide-binding universal stress UspA family protein